jgi:N-alpha-acetyltransferase 30
MHRHQQLEDTALVDTSTPVVVNVSQTATMSNVSYSAPPGIRYVQYQSSMEPQYVPKIRQLISNDLSEPYSIYVYRYFLYQWGDLCFMVRRVQLCRAFG